MKLPDRPNVIDVSTDENMNVRRNYENNELLSNDLNISWSNETNDKHFIDEFIQFKKFVTVELQNIRKEVNSTKVNRQDGANWKNGDKVLKSSNNDNTKQSIQTTNRYTLLYREPVEMNEEKGDNNIQNEYNKHKSIQHKERRPSPVISNYPERDLLNTKLQRSQANKNRVPGNTTYNEAVKHGKKTYVMGTSMLKGIQRNDFNSNLNKCSARFRPFIGATLKQMETYVKPTLTDDTPDVLILHIGCNDVGNRNLTDNDIAEWIVKIGKYCKESGVNYVFISSLVCRAQFTLDKKVKSINNILKNICLENGLGFIDNKNICTDDLYEDGMHLNDDGKIKLAKNFIYVLNKFVL